jgi:antitoxin (DNA-binding transcriptional repressor) of toxin-antitoxin stability system
VKEIGLYEAKTQLSALMAELEATGESFLLTRHGKIVAEVRPYQGTITPKRGCLKSANFHLAPDFDASETGFEDFFEEMQPSAKLAEDEAPYGA